MSIEVGQSAPDFELRDQHGQVLRLSDFAGRQSVALVFYPFAFSGICTGELCEIRDNIGVFAGGDVQVIGVSCDPMHALRAFADAEGYAFPLLSDFWPHGAVSQAYGVFNDQRGAAIRGTFLVDAQGVVRWSVVNGMGEARPLDSYREAIALL
jgi:peroxiredoxin (alkyl hydroperoxide reductase subunit C)